MEALRPTGVPSRILFSSCVLILLSACSATTKVTLTARSATEQQLLVRSLERAMRHMDPSRLSGKSATLDVYGLTADREFAKQKLTVWLRGHGVKIVSPPAKPDLELKIFLSAFGIDHSESLLGLPAFAMPLVGLPVPEIALFKAVKNHGLAQIQTYVFDRRTGRLINQGPVTALGRAKYDHYLLLLVINFTSSDIEEPPEKSD